jgi:hypothetical protein
MTVEDIYWLRITQPIIKPEKGLTLKEKNHKYYLEHKNYFKSKTLFHRHRKKNEN